VRRLVGTVALVGLVFGSPGEPRRCAAQQRPHARVHYLGGNGWAVRIGSRLLVFDYREVAGVTAPSAGGARGLARGSIGPEDLASLDVFVFVTHSHADHFDSIIFGWESRAHSSHYFFGWRAGADPRHHYLVGPRARVGVDGVEVWTINSSQDGVPEVAFLVQVDGWMIYHNGDYLGAFRDDFAYLRRISSHVDLPFLVSGWAREDHPRYQLVRQFVEVFHPARVFLIDRLGQEDRTEVFARFLASRGAETRYLHGSLPGDLFRVSGDSIAEFRRRR